MRRAGAEHSHHDVISVCWSSYFAQDRLVMVTHLIRHTAHQLTPPSLQDSKVHSFAGRGFIGEVEGALDVNRDMPFLRPHSVHGNVRGIAKDHLASDDAD